MLYAHGSDLCHDLELKHAMANSLEALMGAIFLDHGIEHVDRVFGETLFRPSAVTTANCATVTSMYKDKQNGGLENFFPIPRRRLRLFCLYIFGE